MQKSVKLKWNTSVFFEIIFFLGIVIGFLMPSVPRISEIITIVFALLGVALYVARKRLKRIDIIEFLLAAGVMLYSHSTEGIRYFLLLVTLITWSRFLSHSFILLVRLIVWFGLFTSITQILAGMPRIEGFMYQSPPQFACVMLICLTYLLVYLMNKEAIKRDKQSKYDKYVILEIGICIVLIFLSSTRSILAVALIECLYLFICGIVDNSKLKQQHKKVALILLLILGAVVIVLMSDRAVSIFNETTHRSANTLSDSDRTRTFLMSYVISDIKNSPLAIIIGKGGGYVESLLRARTGLVTYLPVHQDFILILAEYGIIGFILFYVVLLRKHKAFPVFLIMFIACSFHNIVLNTRAMILMMWVMCHIEFEGYEYVPGKQFFKRKITYENSHNR